MMGITSLHLNNPLDAVLIVQLIYSFCYYILDFTTFKITLGK